MADGAAAAQRDTGRPGRARTLLTVAILPWGAVFEDFLDTIRVSLRAFETQMTGGWLFNVAHALRLAGVRVVVVLSSESVERPARRVHLPTGTPLLVLPAPGALRRVRRLAHRPRVRQAMHRLRPVEIVLEEAAAYTATSPSVFARELRRVGCGALICQEYEYARSDVHVLIGRAIGIPVFTMFQGANQRWGALQRVTRPLAIRAAAGLIIGSRAEANRLQSRDHVPESKIARIFNPIDEESFEVVPRPRARATLGIPPAARVAVWYGRVERRVKGIDLLLDAWETVCTRRPDLDLRLLLIGTGTDASWLRQRVAQPGVRGVAWRDEYVHDRRVLRLHLAAADVFALPSRREGFPLAPMEAMASGVPVVATAASGLPDILEGGEAAGGIVVACGDAPAFARALERLLGDPALARRIGQRARARALATFSPRAVGLALREFMVEHGLQPRSRADG